MSTQVTLRIHSVKCMDETGGRLAEKFGNDEIYLGGFGIDADGNLVKSAMTEVNSSFDDGDVKNFGPPRRFVTLGLNRGRASSVVAGFLLVEKDAGGKEKALDQIIAKAQEELNKAKQQEVQRISGSGVAAALGPTSWAAVWAIAKPHVEKWVKDKIVAAFNDDPFPLQSVTASVNADGTFSGARTSPQDVVTFRGHDGIYRLTCDWEVS